MDKHGVWQKATAPAVWLDAVASVLSMELFDALVAREILVIISQNSENAGYEKAAALRDYALQKETRRA